MLASLTQWARLLEGKPKSCPSGAVEALLQAEVCCLMLLLRREPTSCLGGVDTNGQSGVHGVTLSVLFTNRATGEAHNVIVQPEVLL